MSEGQENALIGTTVLGRYRIMHSLAQGGMGAVFLGRTEGAEGFARPVVVKRVLPALMQDSSVAELFIREASILSHLQHPNIVSVLDFGQADDGAYVMVLEYVHGFQLGHWLHYVKKVRGKLDVDLALQVVIKVLEALHYAHTCRQANGEILQIVHRDVSPSNVMLTGQGVVKLLDFGIARVSGRGRATDSGGLQGKLPYLPPEAFRGHDPTVQGDVYACGVLLYELLAGTNPFAAGTAAELRRKVEENKPPSLHALREDLPEPIDDVLSQAMHRIPEARQGSAAELGSALRALRSKADDVITEQLSQVLTRDFGPKLAKMVGVLPLGQREKAWRGRGPLSVRPRTPDADLAQESPTVRAQADDELIRALRPSEHPTVPPEGRQAEAPNAEVMLHAGIEHGLTATQPGEHDRPTVEAIAITARPTAGAPPPLGVPAPKAGQPPPLPPLAATPGAAPRGAAGLLWPAVALIAVLISVALWLRPQPPPPAPPPDEFVVIEREDVTPAADAPKPGAPAAMATTGQPQVEPGIEAIEAPPAPDALDAPRVDGSPGPTGAANAAPRKNSTPRQLTIHLQRRRAQFENCFATHAKELEGRPKLELRFQLEPSGKIQSAELFPEALSATGLGRCLLKVAGATRFPRQQELMAFRIPITAITTR